MTKMMITIETEDADVLSRVAEAVKGSVKVEAAEVPEKVTKTEKTEKTEKKKPSRRRGTKKKECPVKVGDIVEFYDDDSKEWELESEIVSIEGTSLLVVPVDEDSEDEDPIPVDVMKDFSDVRIVEKK